ncbi:hypothetical protein GM31_00185 [Trabulsiella odontotermitis]|uniref:Uncharacterized protein n=2 Tax=Trabulsiella odontotermitis TaxID=379893 RepID=A0A0L0GUQ5_9ENTR|nr:hypothetical protein GM31_00185 [Trabulsiella odontotermitis]
MVILCFPYQCFLLAQTLTLVQAPIQSKGEVLQRCISHNGVIAGCSIFNQILKLFDLPFFENPKSNAIQISIKKFSALHPVLILMMIRTKHHGEQDNGAGIQRDTQEPGAERRYVGCTLASAQPDAGSGHAAAALPIPGLAAWVTIRLALTRAAFLLALSSSERHRSAYRG